MIRTLFLPEQIGSYYIFKKRIVCLSIEQKHVSAVCLLYSGKNRELLHSSKEPILFEEHENHELAVADAIKKTLKAVGSYTSLHVMINSSYGIFKELTIPLTDEEKIDQILGFEMEQFIPFPLHEAICDSIIISQDLEKKQSTVFAVAVPKTKIDEYIAIFNNIVMKSLNTMLCQAQRIY